MTAERAKATGRRTPIELVGLLAPRLNSGGMVLINIDCEEDDFFLPLFTSMEKLKEGMEGIHYDKVGQITDAAEFKLELPQQIDGHRLRIIVDIRRVGEKTRFYELSRAN